MAFHDIVLSLDGEGGWSLHPGHRSLEAKQAAAEQARAAAAAGSAALETQLTSPRGVKVRGADAAAVLKGMTARQEGEEQLGDGNEGFAGAAGRWLPGGWVCLGAGWRLAWSGRG